MSKKIKTVLWDFDGVILDSMKIRDWGFRRIFKDFSEEEVEKLIIYHRKNGGLSRYVKIKYFYEEIIGRDINENEINEYANEFSILMKQKLTDKNNLINDSVEFIKREKENYKFHIVSGSDQAELRFLCEKLEIAHFFISIHGSPTPKKQLVKDLMSENNYSKESTCLIGDSINDWEAANENQITFFGYNNSKLKDISQNYIQTFDNFHVFH